MRERLTGIRQVKEGAQRLVGTLSRRAFFSNVRALPHPPGRVHIEDIGLPDKLEPQPVLQSDLQTDRVLDIHPGPVK